MKSSLLEFTKTRDFNSFITQSLQSTREIDELVAVSLNGEDIKSSNTGSWVCTHLVATEKKYFQKRQTEIIDFLEKGTHQSSLRNWMKVLTYLEIDEIHHARVIDLCAKHIANSDNKVALQVYSMFVLAPLVCKYPEILEEIDSLIDLHSYEKTAAYSSSARKFKKLTKKVRQLKY